jgi:hypothetical protein
VDGYPVIVYTDICRRLVMEITFLNGQPERSSGRIHAIMKGMMPALIRRSHQPVCFNLAEMNLRTCNGCWGCWVKTPGKCVLEDDISRIHRRIMDSRLVVFTSPVLMGFTSARLKRVMDRMIPLLHPHLSIIRGECHHEKRYTQYPDLGLLLEWPEGEDREDREIITGIYRRFALNFHSRLLFVKDLDDWEEVIDEIDGI